MKSETLLKFSRLVVKRITDLLVSRFKLTVPDDKQKIILLASKFDSPDLNELVFALRRIDKGVFGQCVICRHDIPEDVLESDLTARFCPSCQLALSEKGEATR
jgi:RNA polymerase-binding transcription factor DksA